MSTHNCAAFRCDLANNVHFRQDGSEIISAAQRQAADSNLADAFHARTHRCISGSHLVCAITEGKHRADIHGDCLLAECDDAPVRYTDQQRPSLADFLDPDGSRARAKAEEKGFDARSTTSPEGRTVQVVMTAAFARQVAYSLIERIAAVGADSTEGRWLSGFVADLAKVNP